MANVKGKQVKPSRPKKPRKHRNAPTNVAVTRPTTPLYQCNNDNGRCGLRLRFKENPPTNPTCFCRSSVTLIEEVEPDAAKEATAESPEGDSTKGNKSE